MTGKGAGPKNSGLAKLELAINPRLNALTAAIVNNLLLLAMVLNTSDSGLLDLDLHFRQAGNSSMKQL
jgi:hypothetical protein